MSKRRMRVNEFEIQTLREIAERNDCPIEMVIDALMNNVVSEQLSIQIEYMKSGKLPE